MTRASRQSGECAAALMLAAPGLLLLTVLFVGPVVAVFGIALTDWQLGTRHLSFVGSRNFQELLADGTFRRALLNTALYVLIVVPCTVGAGLLLALLIESGRSFRGFYRTVHFLPYMATLAAMAMAWEALLHPTIGLANQALSGLGLPTANWLRDETTVLPVLAAIGIWQQAGFATVMFLAGLKSIPTDLYDAADIDGADHAVDRLVTVTLPLLGPVAVFVLVITGIRAFSVFDTVQILTKGGPGHASDTLMFTLYRESFEYLRTGYGAAVTVVFLACVAALTLLQVRLLDRRVHYS